MEIRHRKQWLTGKMVAQVQSFDGDWYDACEMSLPWREQYIRSQNETLHSQLSEALGKQQETGKMISKEAYEDLLKISGEFRDERNLLRRRIAALEFDMRSIEGQTSVTRSELSKAVEANLKQGLASGGLRGDELRMVMEAIKVPHHGPGLSEAEDAMRPAGVVGKDESVLSQEQIAEAFGVKPEQILRDDLINHPSHYQGDNGIECIDAIQSALTPEEFRGYCKGNVMKYTWRERTKQGDAAIRKARWYMNRMFGDE